MREWLSSQLAAAHSPLASRVVVLDPQHLLAPSDVAEMGEVFWADDWFQLRRAWEHEVKDRAAGTRRGVIVSRSEEFRRPRDLPYDIEQRSRVCVVSSPVPAGDELLLDGLEPATVDRVIELLGDVGTRTEEAACEALGIPVVDPNAAREAQTRMALQAAMHGEVGPALRQRLIERVDVDVARELLADAMNPGPLQQAWAEFVAGSDGALDFGQLRSETLMALSSGLLRPAPGDRDVVPSWAWIGIEETPSEDRLAALLAEPPAVDSATSLSHWIEIGMWLGTARSLASRTTTVDPALEAWWSQADSAFLDWVMRSFGEQLFRTGELPFTVAQIAPFLKKRIASGQTERVLLCVLDGLGFAQWSQIRDRTGIAPVEATGVLAMLPTRTEISRQSIFAGALPTDFVDTLGTVSAEKARWEAFWAASGLAQSVAYLKTGGGAAPDVPDLGGYDIVGMAVAATDEMLHDAKVLGDAQLTASIDTWIDHGFLTRLIEAAHDEGYEMWIASDHGNLECTPVGGKQEGVAVDKAGYRVRHYPNADLRSKSAVEGLVWDPPCLSQGEMFPLFATGRDGFFTGGRRVTHGGLSLDEVIVPFVRVV